MNPSHYPDIEIWKTVSSNTKYEVSNIGRCRRIGGSILGLDGNEIRKWGSISDVERELGISTSNISKCCKGVFKQAGGFKWIYL